MRAPLFILILSFVALALKAQTPIYDFISFQKSLSVPPSLNSERTAVIFNVPTEHDAVAIAGEHQKMIQQAHKAFVTMGVDAILYLDQHDYMAGKRAMETYQNLFAKRKVEQVLFLTKREEYFELLLAPISASPFLIEHTAEVFYLKDPDLYSLLLRLGKEIRRADQKAENFLIPEKPYYLDGLSIVEKSALKNYPSILRRSTLAVERFAPLEIPEAMGAEASSKILSYNAQIEKDNHALEQLMASYPFPYVLIDPMSETELIRKRYQYVLRSVAGKAESIRKMLDYEVLDSETGFISLIPAPNGKTTTVTLPRRALAHKFYIKQTLSKNIHLGEWDADSSWQQALENFIGNLSQKLKN